VARTILVCTPRSTANAAGYEEQSVRESADVFLGAANPMTGKVGVFVSAPPGWRRSGSSLVRSSVRSRRSLLRLGEEHDVGMKKAIVFAVAAIGLVVVAKRFAPKMENIDWEARFERLPDNSPPKWMFNNIRAIRENTDRILELLTGDRPPTSEPEATPTE
jgi:hypothetical protein